MKPSSKKSAGPTKSRSKKTKATLGQTTTKPLVLALAGRMLKKGGKRPGTGRPPAQPIFLKIKGNPVSGTGDSCGMIGDLADKAVDDMERAITNDDEEALDKAIEDFQHWWDFGHSHGCYFTYV